MPVKKKAFLTGTTGQVASYLAEILLENGYEVHGLIRRTSQPVDRNIKHLEGKIQLHPGDLTDSGSLTKAIELVMPDEIYNLGAMSQVRWSYEIPVLTMDINCLGFIRIIEIVRQLGLDCKIYNAASSEMFGKVLETPQNEKTPFYPRSPYGVSKAAAFYMARVYRESYGMKIYSGILFNNESPRRGEEFLSRKVCMGIADIVAGRKNKLVLGNLDAKRDFGYSKDYAFWIWRIMQHDTPDDFVIATGETHSVKEFVQLAFKYAGIEDWESRIEYDPKFMRPAEVDVLIGDASKSKRILGFEPKIKFNELVRIMMQHELNQKV